MTDIVEIIRKCDCWGRVKDDGGKFGRYYVEVHFATEKDAKAFAVELMMVTTGQAPYGDPQ